MLGFPNDDNRPTRIIHNGKNGQVRDYMSIFMERLLKFPRKG